MSGATAEDPVTCLVCGRVFEKEIAAAWHEDQTGHDRWSDTDGEEVRE